MKPTVVLIDFRQFLDHPHDLMIEKISGIETANTIPWYSCGKFMEEASAKVLIDIGWKVTIRLPNKKDWDSMPSKKEVIPRLGRSMENVDKATNQLKQPKSKKIYILKVRRDK